MLTLGPFGNSGNGDPVPLTPPDPPYIVYAAYGDINNSTVYIQGVTESTSGPFGTITGPLSPLYFATQATAEQVAQILNGTVSSINVGASVLQLMINLVETKTVNGKSVTAIQQYNAGLLANGLYHGDVTPANSGTLN